MTVMAWLLVIVAGLFETGFAVLLKQSHGITRLWPTVGFAICALRVVFRGASAWCQQPVRKTYTGPSVLTPFYPRLLVVCAAGDFEQVPNFGVGLADGGSYRAYALTGPDRMVLDFGHVTLGKFPGIWDITSWRQYWGRQYSWGNGHQPWLGNPEMVIEAWLAAGGTPPLSCAR